jgi:hypothetical protein
MIRERLRALARIGAAVNQGMAAAGSADTL